MKKRGELHHGLPLKEGSEAKDSRGQHHLRAYTKSEGAWCANVADEGRLVDTPLRKGRDAHRRRTSSVRGNPTTDKYSLNGIGQALDRRGAGSAADRGPIGLPASPAAPHA